MKINTPSKMHEFERWQKSNYKHINFNTNIKFEIGEWILSLANDKLKGTMRVKSSAMQELNDRRVEVAKFWL